MNKRGQVYILAAIVLCVAIYGVIKITNKLEPPSKMDNFDFYVENFVGERAYVMDLGYLQNVGPGQYLTENLNSSDENLLSLFTKLGFNVGVVLVSYDIKREQPWVVVNYLSQDVKTCSGEECSSLAILPSAQEEAGGLSFSLTGEGKKFYLGIADISDVGDKYFVKRYLDTDVINVFVDGSKYSFNRPVGDKVESILFKNLDKDYVKVVKV